MQYKRQHRGDGDAGRGDVRISRDEFIGGFHALFPDGATIESE
jgi:hypothetical protein